MYGHLTNCYALKTSVIVKNIISKQNFVVMTDGRQHSDQANQLETVARLVPDTSTIALLLARDVIYTSHAYATMSVSICLSVYL